MSYITLYQTVIEQHAWKSFIQLQASKKTSKDPMYVYSLIKCLIEKIWNHLKQLIGFIELESFNLSCYGVLSIKVHKTNKLYENPRNTYLFVVNQITLDVQVINLE